jgi:hypothetical protein
MRNFINLIDSVLFESRGLGARRTGEEFISTTNPEYKIFFDNVTFYPSGGTQYPSYDVMVMELQKIVNSYRGTINLIKRFTDKDRAFGIAEFVTQDNQKLAWVKPFKDVKLDKTLNDWNNQTGIPGFKYNSKAAAKTQAGLTPQDILKSKQSDLTASEIIEQISNKFGKNSPLVLIAQAVANAQPFPIIIAKPEGIEFTAFRDYFCELLHPIALQTGKFKGNAGEAAAKFIGADGFSQCSINFGSDKTEGLSDSILIAPDGRKIKVSSKGAGGAEASARNILDSVRELEKNDSKLANKHKETIDIIQTIVENGQAGAPLSLGVKFNIINDKDAESIRQFKNQAPTTLSSVKDLNISKKLKELILERSTNNPDNVNLYFHSIAAVAHKVAAYINAKTNFSQSASEILNNAALVQVYTSAREEQDRWVLEGFDTKWPSDTTTGVKFSATKTYYSTGIKGNFTFKILRNGAIDIGDDSGEISDMSASSKKSKKDLEPVDIRPTAVKAKEKKANIGRQER